ncbi:MAG: glutamyl-tRNA reductase, partial [candidate division Zixibacteria bacterium]
ALELGSVSSLLNRLFHKAIECGKLVRERTAISKGAVSVAFAAVDLAGKIYGNLDNLNVLIIGAGQTGQLAARHFKKAGVKSWKISNRTQERADELSEELSAESVPFPPAEDVIGWADIIVSATGAPGYVIEANSDSKLGEDKDNPVCFLDLAVPRDIDPRFKEYDNVFVYSVDDFNEMVGANKAARQKEAARAEKFVSQRVESFVKWHRENRVAPTIQQLQEIIEGIRLAEIEKNAKRFCEDDREKVDEFSKSLVKKILGLLIVNMKKASVDQDDLSLARAVLLAFSQQNKDNLNEILEKIDYELSHR